MQRAADANGLENALDDVPRGTRGERPAGGWRKRLLIGGKLAVSAGLLGWVLTDKVDLAEAAGRMATIPVAWLSLAFAATALAYLAVTLRWRLILGALGVPLGFADAWWITWMGMFFNQALPSNVAGDVVRIWRVQRRGPSLGRAVSSVMLDRVVALGGLALLVALCLPASLALIGMVPAWYALVALVLAIVSGLALLLVFDRALTPLRRLLPRRAVGAADALARDARAAVLDPRVGPLALGISTINFAMVAGIVWALAAGLGLAIDFLDVLVLFPPVLLVSMLPVSFAGWGVRELAMATALGFVGVPETQAVALSLAFGLVALAAALPGGLIWFLTGNRCDLTAGGAGR